MALRTRADRFGLETGIRTPLLYPTSRLLANLVGATIPRNKAVIGDNAFAHESGIHQHGMLKNRETYEIMRPEDVGFSRTQLVMGKHSGRHALRERLAGLGHELDDAKLDEVFTRFKTLADKKREVFDSDLDALALGQDPEALGPWRLENLHASTHLGGGASASVKLRHEDGRLSAEAAIGDGPVHAVLRAMERASGISLDIAEFQVRSLSYGADAQGRATLDVRQTAASCAAVAPRPISSKRPHWPRSKSSTASSDWARLSRITFNRITFSQISHNHCRSRQTKPEDMTI